MVFSPKSAGLALSLGLAARGATAVSNCAGLIDAIGVSATVVVESDFSCSKEITIAPDVTVNVSGPHMITIAADFVADAATTDSSLFVNEGSLTLDGITVESQAALGIRAVHNEGDLSLVGCTFSSLSGTRDSMLSVGGVVSGPTAVVPHQSRVATLTQQAVCFVNACVPVGSFEHPQSLLEGYVLIVCS